MKTKKRKEVAVYKPADAETAKRLEEFKSWLRSSMAEGGGAVCPCCTQFTKVYERSINASMAVVLILLFRRSNGEWIHVQKFLAAQKLPSAIMASGDYAKLRFWGFLEHADGDRADGSSRNGFWRITEAGRQFVRGETSAPAHAVVFNDRLLRLDDSKTVTIREALGKKFNYEELMEPVLRVVPSVSSA